MLSWLFIYWFLGRSLTSHTGQQLYCDHHQGAHSPERRKERETPHFKFWNEEALWMKSETSSTNKKFPFIHPTIHPPITAYQDPLPNYSPWHSHHQWLRRNVQLLQFNHYKFPWPGQDIKTSPSNVDVINQLNTNCIKTKKNLINDQKRKEMKLCGYKLTLEMSNIFTYPQNIFVWIVALCCWGYLRKTQTDQYKISK